MKALTLKALLVFVLVAVLVLSMAACKKPAETTAADTTAAPTDPVVTDPDDSDPVVTDPDDSDPVVTDPEDSDPVVTDPPATDPADTTPSGTDPDDTTAPVTKPAETTPGKDHLCYFVEMLVIPPTCESSGFNADVCVYCGEEKNLVDIGPSGHDNEMRTGVAIDSLKYHKATVTVCKRCDKTTSIVSFDETDVHSFFEANGDMDLVIVPDKIDANGNTVYGYTVIKCKDADCGFSFKINANATDGHYYIADPGTGKYNCACGHGALSGGIVPPTFNNNPSAGPVIAAPATQE